MADAVIPKDTVSRISRGSAFWLVAAVSVFLLVCSTVPSPMYVIYASRWHFSAAMITIIFSVYGVFVLAGMLMFGGLSDVIGRRPVLLAAVFLAVVSLVLFTVAWGVGALLIARAVQGVAVGIASGAIGAALIELAPPGSPGRGTLLGSTTPIIGLAAGALGAGVLVDHAPGPTVLSYVVLLVAGLLVMVAIAGVPETATATAQGISTVLAPRRVSVSRSARRCFTLISLSVVAVWAVGGIYLSLGPSIVAEILHSRSHVLGGLAITALAGSGAVAQVSCQRMRGRRPLLLGALLMLSGLILVALALAAGSAVVFFGGTVALGFGWGATYMASFRLAAGLAEPDHRGELITAIYIVAYAAASVPAVGAGVAAQHFGLHTAMAASVAVVGGLVILAMLTLPQLPSGQRVPEADRAHDVELVRAGGAACR
jgi:MFS family permease